MTDLNTRIERGAAFLDGREPGWWQRIDLETLDLDESCRCVLGQLATDLGDPERGVWPRVCDQFGVRATGWDNDDNGRARDIDLGFITDGEYVEELTAAWRALIEARRG